MDNEYVRETKFPEVNLILLVERVLDNIVLRIGHDKPASELAVVLEPLIYLPYASSPLFFLGRPVGLWPRDPLMTDISVSLSTY